jgi:quercetin dioxygenase-like cupin family protein
MKATTDEQYTIAGRESIAETQDLRVTLMTLAPGEATPWHRHTVVVDTTFVLDGEVEVQAMAPEETIPLVPGRPCRIQPGRPHRLVNAARWPGRYLLVQGIGAYDFIKV